MKNKDNISKAFIGTQDDEKAREILKNTGIESLKSRAGYIAAVTDEPILMSVDEFFVTSFGRWDNIEDYAAAWVVYIHQDNGLYPHQWEIIQKHFERVQDDVVRDWMISNGLEPYKYIEDTSPLCQITELLS